jgi:hypothetical protein
VLLVNQEGTLLLKKYIFVAIPGSYLRYVAGHRKADLLAMPASCEKSPDHLVGVTDADLAAGML